MWNGIFGIIKLKYQKFLTNHSKICFNIDNDVMENQFSINNSFWFITGTFLRQGSGLNPKVKFIDFFWLVFFVRFWFVLFGF